MTVNQTSAARHRQLGELFDRPGQWRHLQPAELVFRNSEPGHRLDHVDDRREAAGQRPGLSRQPERDRDHQDRRRSDRRRVCRFHAWHSRQRLQQGQSQLCRQWRLRGRLERRLDHGRAGRLRRPPRRHGGEFGRRLGSVGQGRHGFGRAGDAEPDRRQFSSGRRPDEHEDGRWAGAHRRLRQGPRRRGIGAAQGGDGGAGDPQCGQRAGRIVGDFGARQRRFDHSRRRPGRGRLGDGTTQSLRPDGLEGRSRSPATTSPCVRPSSRRAAPRGGAARSP